MTDDKKSDLLVVVKAKELGAYILTVTQKSPKQFRFTFISRLQNLALDVIEKIYFANEIYIGKGGEKNVEKRLSLQHSALNVLFVFKYVTMSASTQIFCFYFVFSSFFNTEFSSL